MKCKYCKEDFISIFSERCPFCGKDNSMTWGEVFSPIPDQTEPIFGKGHDSDDWGYFDNCSDREYDDDEDYDDV